MKRRNFLKALVGSLGALLLPGKEKAIAAKPKTVIVRTGRATAKSTTTLAPIAPPPLIPAGEVWTHVTRYGAYGWTRHETVAAAIEAGGKPGVTIFFGPGAFLVPSVMRNLCIVGTKQTALVQESYPHPAVG